MGCIQLAGALDNVILLEIFIFDVYATFRLRSFLHRLKNGEKPCL